MNVSIGCDHGGYFLKEEIKKYLINSNVHVLDRGCYSIERVDYPIYAKDVAVDVSKKDCDFGILVCTTGIGMSICANKVKGVRAALVCCEEASKLTREHNNSNVLCLGAKFTPIDEAIKIVKTFLSQKFDGDINKESRHIQRVNLINKMEEE